MRNLKDLIQTFYNKISCIYMIQHLSYSVLGKWVAPHVRSFVHIPKHVLIFIDLRQYYYKPKLYFLHLNITFKFSTEQLITCMYWKHILCRIEDSTSYDHIYSSLRILCEFDMEHQMTCMLIKGCIVCNLKALVFI